MKKLILFLLLISLFNFSIGECCSNEVQTYLKKKGLTMEELTEDDQDLFEENFTSTLMEHPERNNPFDIAYSEGSKNFLGCTGESGGFCVFDTKEHGMRAGMMLVYGYIRKKYNTPEKFINRYSATDQETYIKFISMNMGMKENEKFCIDNTTECYCKLGHLITVFEGQFGKEGCSQEELQTVVTKFKLGSCQEKDFQKMLNSITPVFDFNDLQ